MPKENVYSDTYPYGKDSPARSVAEVSWYREAGHVQLATRCIRADDETSYDNPEFATLNAADGWYIDLDRAGINRLISNLRRARDQAFGKDE